MCCIFVRSCTSHRVSYQHLSPCAFLDITTPLARLAWHLVPCHHHVRSSLSFPFASSLVIFCSLADFLSLCVIYYASCLSSSISLYVTMCVVLVITSLLRHASFQSPLFLQSPHFSFFEPALFLS